MKPTHEKRKPTLCLDPSYNNLFSYFRTKNPTVRTAPERWIFDFLLKFDELYDVADDSGKLAASPCIGIPMRNIFPEAYIYK